MQLTIQTNLNGCQVYVYNHKLRLIPVIIKSTDYSGGNNVLVRRFLIEAAPWENVKKFYIGNSIFINGTLTPVTENNVTSILPSYLEYAYTGTFAKEEDRYTGIDWSLPRQVDFGEAFTDITAVTDIYKFIFNDVTRFQIPNGDEDDIEIIRVNDAEDTKARIKVLFGEDAWFEVFKLTPTEYKTLETEMITNILYRVASARDIYDTLMKYYRNTEGQSTSDSAYSLLQNDKTRLETCLTHLNREFT